MAPQVPRPTRALRTVGWLSLLSNATLVVTGGAVRLTGSGLGCPTWPRCTQDSFTPHGQLSAHSAIEFGNRLMTFVLVAIALATCVVAYRHGQAYLRKLSILLALGIPAQAILGGVTVLTDLNPWVVSGHLLLSMLLISGAVLFLERIDHSASVGVQPAPALGWAVYLAGWVTLYVGTVVTGSGPHAGDADVPRNGLDPLQLSQLHADAVFLFVGLTIAVVIFASAQRRGPRAALFAASATLLIVQLAQGVVGYAQYFTGLPIALVGVHLLGAAVIAAAMTKVLLVAGRPN